MCLCADGYVNTENRNKAKKRGEREENRYKERTEKGKTKEGNREGGEKIICGRGATLDCVGKEDLFERRYFS